MSEEKPTLKLGAISGDSQTDDDEDATTSRIVSRTEDKTPAVPGENPTMPLPAIAASKTTTSRVPDSLLEQSRGDASEMADTVERRPLGRREIDGTVPFQTLDVELEAIADETRNVKGGAVIEFLARLDDEGLIKVPKHFAESLADADMVAVRLVAIAPPSDS